jgi:hypothetical protein
MYLNKKYSIVIIICLCSLLCACSSEYYYEKWLRERIKKNAEAEKLEEYQLQYELQNFVDYELLDSCERLQYSITDLFTVAKIYEGKEVFEIILLSSNNSYYEVYSPKVKSPQGKKIKEGKMYKMTIVPYFKMERTRPIEIVRPVYIKGYRIIPYPISFGQVYYTDNLEGRFFLSGEQ